MCPEGPGPNRFSLLSIIPDWPLFAYLFPALNYKIKEGHEKSRGLFSSRLSLGVLLLLAPKLQQLG